MATYAQLQTLIKARAGFVPKTCWLAHVRADHGLTRGAAPNRRDPTRRLQSCPPAKRAAIEAVMRDVGMIA